MYATLPLVMTKRLLSTLVKLFNVIPFASANSEILHLSVTWFARRLVNHVTVLHPSLWFFILSFDFFQGEWEVGGGKQWWEIDR